MTPWTGMITRAAVTSGMTSRVPRRHRNVPGPPRSSINRLKKPEMMKKACMRNSERNQTKASKTRAPGGSLITQWRLTV